MSFRLYADVGNTTLHLGLWCDGWVLERRLGLDGLDDGDAWGQALRDALEAAGLRAQDCAGAAALVGARGRENLCAALNVVCGTPPRTVGADIRVPLPVEYDDPSALGQDRLLAGFAAWRLTDCPCIVLDAGTCLTCDAVARDGILRPVAISAGLPALMAGLTVTTPHLADAARAARDTLPRRQGPCAAHSTADSLAAGLEASLAGAARWLVDGARALLGEPPAPVVVTGGDGDLVARCLEGPVTVLPLLILEGLRLLDDGGPAA